MTGARRMLRTCATFRAVVGGEVVPIARVTKPVVSTGGKGVRTGNLGKGCER